MKTTRTYTMTARAAGRRATPGSPSSTPPSSLRPPGRFADISLDDIAAEAGVSVQTVLRRFGSRAGLIDAATDHGGRDGRYEERARLRSATSEAAVAVVVAHYERRGDGVSCCSPRRTARPARRRITDSGQPVHREWVETVFAPYLPGAPTAREELVDLLAVATDVYTWKLLRRDRGLDRTTHRTADPPPGVRTHRPGVTMADILFVTWDGGGNVPPALGIARELQAQGHAVRFLGHEIQAQELAASRACEFAPARDARSLLRALGRTRCPR